MRDILRQAGPAILALASLTFDVGNFFGSALIAYAIWVAAAIWAGYVYWPGIKRWRPFTLAPANLNNPDTEVVAKRKAVKDLLADALDQGNILRQSHRKDDEGRIKITSYQDVVAWVDRTHDLIEAAFDKAEARHFMNSNDYKPEKPLPWREVRVDPYKYHLRPRLRRLDQLIVRASELPINPDFDPQDWLG